MRRLFSLFPVLALAVATLSAPVSADEASLFKALKGGGHVALIRHALAPGTGDPDNFELGKCETQRNLSDEGRAQAQRMGEKLRVNGLAQAFVYSSQWCRCLDTARLMALGPVTEIPQLNSLYRHPERRESQTRDLRDWIAAQREDAPLVLVTHQFTINGIVGEYTKSGEIVVARRDRDGSLTVVGTIETN
ncbi:MAG: histidine phosphatase family protein [Rhodospirillaceae bacterium]